MHQRFIEEGLLAALRNRGSERLEVDPIHNEAGELVRTKTDDEILADVGRAVPEEGILFLLRVDEISRRHLARTEIRYLPPPENLVKNATLGQTVLHSLKRRLWRAMCDPASEIHKAWYKEGMSFVLSRKYYAIAVASACLELGLCVKALAVSAVAMLIKLGVEVFCDVYQPKGLMISRKEKED